MSNYELIEISPSKLLDSKGEKGNMYVVKPINHCTNFEIGFPIPKKFVKAIEI